MAPVTRRGRPAVRADADPTRSAGCAHARRGAGPAGRASPSHGHRRRHATSHRSIPGRSEEHTSELQSLMRISYAVFCLKKKIKQLQHKYINDNEYLCYVQTVYL